jgi:GNAT superfamily N-acetyltransferase
VQLRPVATDDDWAQKRSLHERTHERSDGHPCTAAEWTDLERRKADAGGLLPYLVEVDGHVQGAVATMSTPSLLRLKNLVVDPRSRCRGIGTAVLHAVHALAATAGKTGVGTLGVDGSAGARLYTRAGLTPVGCHVELMREIT